MARTQQGYFRTYDGLKLFYSCEGPVNAPTLVFCYGLVCSKLQWKYQIEYLKKDYRIFYMDFRGHNNSETPTDISTLTLENLARDLAYLMEELGIESSVILGHSLGVNVVLELYRQFPEKVRAMVLANGTPKDPFENMFHHNFLQIVIGLAMKGYYKFPEPFLKFWEFQSVSPLNYEFISRAGFNHELVKPEDVKEYLRISGTVDLGVFFQLISSYMKYNACNWLEQVDVPSLIIGGEYDHITPIASQKIMHRLMPKSRLEIIKDGSHSSQMEQPELLNKMIEEFVSQYAVPLKVAKKLVKSTKVNKQKRKSKTTKVKKAKKRIKSNAGKLRSVSKKSIRKSPSKLQEQSH